MGSKQLEDEVRRYIFDNYDAFASSDLTFRMLKTHLSSKLGVDYESFGSDTELGQALDDEVEAITLRCETGKLSADQCVWSPTSRSRQSVWPVLAVIFVLVNVVRVFISRGTRWRRGHRKRN